MSYRLYCARDLSEVVDIAGEFNGEVKYICFTCGEYVTGYTWDELEEGLDE